MSDKSKHIELARRRQAICDECLQIKRDLDSYNENHPNEEDIVLDWDFLKEVEESGCLRYGLKQWGEFEPRMRLRTRLRLWWHRLFIRKDEFDKSLSMDVMAMLEMSPKQCEAYRVDLARRRMIAHDRDLAAEDEARAELKRITPLSAELSRLAKKYPVPQEWYNDTCGS